MVQYINEQEVWFRIKEKTLKNKHQRQVKMPQGRPEPLKNVEPNLCKTQNVLKLMHFEKIRGISFLCSHITNTFGKGTNSLPCMQTGAWVG